MAQMIVEWTKTGKLGQMDLGQSAANGSTREKSEVNLNI